MVSPSAKSSQFQWEQDGTRWNKFERFQVPKHWICTDVPKRQAPMPPNLPVEEIPSPMAYIPFPFTPGSLWDEIQVVFEEWLIWQFLGQNRKWTQLRAVSGLGFRTVHFFP